MKRWLRNVLISLDQFLNTLALGDPDETISSRIGKAVGRSSIARFMCRLLDLIDRGHCEDAVEEDEGGDRA